ncbi:MAG: CoA ester lyase [Acidisphaera sp.]|nr:CoA ester lyase [Acidisphaera sp.]
MNTTPATSRRPLWRSLLFVPAINDRFVAGAAKRGADGILLDLEDSIPPARKAEARGRVAEAARIVAAGGPDVLVRINRPWRMALADMEACVGPDVTALLLPKVPNAAHVHAAAEVLDELERERGLAAGHTGLLLLIETPEGLTRINEIAAAHPRVIGITVGSEDLSSAMGMVPDADSLFVPKMLAAIAARAAGVLPFGYVGSIADFSDIEAFRAVVRRARRLGFAGASCIHPNQVTVLNEEFSPTAEEIANAQGIVAAFEAGLREGSGAVQHEGRMLDLPVVDQARAVLERDAAIRRRAAR